MKLSIIVPIYGVECYIIDFAKSLFPQLDERVELILINDGTKDESFIKIKKFYQEYYLNKLNVIFLEQENQGQSVARNFGIKICKGDYVTFLDPDDIVASNYILKIMPALNNNPDMIQFNAKVFSKDISNFENYIILAKDTEFINVNKKNIINIYKKNFWFSWLRVTKREFLTDNFFPKKVNYQDMMAFPQIYKSINTIQNLEEFLVYYRVHQSSSVNIFSPKLIKSADYGLKMYEGCNDSFDQLIYQQFIDLRFNLTITSSGLLFAYKWYYFDIYKNKYSKYYSSVLKLVFTFLKFFVILIYRNFKQKIGL
ncbi:MULTISPECIES: glycosyltransferase [unclassified Acinetobacter]|uniref:glycosyltransferase family 2 protein n=1 Tax=unclassified Acinetobacter TaxID=196816 RepID=UPI0015D1E7BA|nr:MULTISPECIES: glycosyltransferase [unclassified Acinetobacter]UUS60881.1 glycosyltransferase [Acinetobacter sp. YH16056_T]